MTIKINDMSFSILDFGNEREKIKKTCDLEKYFKKHFTNLQRKACITTDKHTGDLYLNFRFKPYVDNIKLKMCCNDTETIYSIVYTNMDKTALDNFKKGFAMFLEMYYGIENVA